MITAVADPVVETEAVMREVREDVRAELYARMLVKGSGDDFDSRAVFDAVDELINRALSHDDFRGQLLAARLNRPWLPALSLDIRTHRPGLTGRAIVFVKTRLLVPATRFLFEHVTENARRQHRVNIALMACLQTLAADHVRLEARVAARARRAGG
jgi:hypothetical protein